MDAVMGPNGRVSCPQSVIDLLGVRTEVRA
jgi:hypothetical protein